MVGGSGDGRGSPKRPSEAACTPGAPPPPNPKCFLFFKARRAPPTPTDATCALSTAWKAWLRSPRCIGVRRLCGAVGRDCHHGARGWGGVGATVARIDGTARAAAGRTGLPSSAAPPRQAPRRQRWYVPVVVVGVGGGGVAAHLVWVGCALAWGGGRGWRPSTPPPLPLPKLTLARHHVHPHRSHGQAMAHFRKMVRGTGAGTCPETSRRTLCTRPIQLTGTATAAGRTSLRLHSAAGPTQQDYSSGSRSQQTRPPRALFCPRPRWQGGRRPLHAPAFQRP